MRQCRTLTKPHACAQQPARLRTCRFYAGEMAMSALALAAAFYGIASVNKWSFSVFLTLQGAVFLILPYCSLQRQQLHTANRHAAPCPAIQEYGRFHAGQVAVAHSVRLVANMQCMPCSAHARYLRMLPVSVPMQG